jgi:hypothetical protein
MIQGPTVQKTARNWQVSSGRLTLFYKAGLSPVTWRSLTGVNPSMSNVQGQISTEAGPFSGAQLTVQNQPNRVDLLFLPGPSGASSGPASLGGFPAGVSPFLAAIPNWLGKLSGIVRLAVGLQLFEVSKSMQDANQRLGSLIPKLGIDLSPTSDFLLQLNVPISSKIRTGLTVNRVFKLMVNQVQEFVITTTGFHPGTPTVVAGMDIDISTAVDNTMDLSGSGFDKLVDELASIALEIGKSGPPL